MKERTKINAIYSHDGKHLYFHDQQQDIPGIDLQTIQPAYKNVYGYNWLKDKNHVYYYDIVVEGADPNSIEHIGKSSGDYAKDKNHVFFMEYMIKGANPKTFQVDKYKDCYTADDKQVFFNMKKSATM